MCDFYILECKDSWGNTPALTPQFCVRVTGAAVSVFLQAPGLQPAQLLVGPRNDATVRALQQPVCGGDGGRPKTERPVEENSQLQSRPQVRHRYKCLLSLGFSGFFFLFTKQQSVPDTCNLGIFSPTAFFLQIDQVKQCSWCVHVLMLMLIT